MRILTRAAVVHSFPPQGAAIARTGILACASLALFVLVAKSPKRFVYDEPYYFEYLNVLHQYGLSTAFLVSLPAAAGPLYAFVQSAFQRWTQLTPIGMRLVNVFLLALVGALIAASAKPDQHKNRWTIAMSVLTVPMTWVIAGISLTEMPAMVFVSLSLFLQIRGLAALNKQRSSLGWFILSGLSFGISLWGRQTYVPLFSVPILLAIADHRLLKSVVAFVVIALSSLLPLIVIWKGLVPPAVHSLQQGISITHMFLSLGYAGVCYVLLGAQLRWISTKRVIATFAVMSVVNVALLQYTISPLKSVVDRYLPSYFEQAYGLVCGSAFLSLGVVFLQFLVSRTLAVRNDLRSLALYSGLLCIVISPIFVAHQYSSRYTAMALPYIVLVISEHSFEGISRTIAACLGCSLGVLSLAGYFWS